MTKTALEKLLSAAANKPKKIEIMTGISYWFTPMTPEDAIWIEDRVGDAKGSAEVWKRAVMTFIKKACDKDGNQVFQPGDQYELMKSVPIHVFTQLSTAVYGKSVEEAKEAIGADPNLETASK